MKKRILALLIIAFSLSACQPTPEEEIVIGKIGAQGEPVAQAHAEAPAVPFAAPAQAAYEWEKNGLMVSIDAKVFVPNVDRYPIYGASNEAWSQQQLDAISPIFKFSTEVRKVIYTTNAIESLNSTYRKLNRQRSVFPSDTALLKALYLATFEATKKWTMPIRNWGQVYGELSIMYEGRLPE